MLLLRKQVIEIYDKLKCFIILLKLKALKSCEENEKELEELMKTERSCSSSSTSSVSLNSSMHQESDEHNSFKYTQQKPVKQKKTTKSKIYYYKLSIFKF
jgi:hypothetical protein